ncbi:hypothetical protein B0A67_24545 [Flavobacterium aquidurense]|nr:hypothetical protein B0A67_24545 [Flavobacterium aquidurense]
MDKTADQWIEFEKAEQGLIDCIQNHLSVFGILPTKEHCFGIYYEVEGRNKYMYINIQYYLANNEDSVRVLYVEIEDNGFCG